MSIELLPFRHNEAAVSHTKVIRYLDTLINSEYAGRYYDNNENVLHINILEDEKKERMTANINRIDTSISRLTQYIQIHYVKYSLEKMLGLQRIVESELLGHYGFHTVFYSPKNNQITIGITSDVTDDVYAYVSEVMSKRGYTDSAMYKIEKMEQPSCKSSFIDFSGNPVDFSNGVPDRLANDATFYVSPGGWVGFGSSVQSIVSICSITTGFLFTGFNGFLTCGHTQTRGQKAFYAPIPSSGSYPADLWSYSESWLKEIGTVEGVYYQANDAYDCAAIRRTNMNSYMSPTNYAGGTIDGDSGIPEVGDRILVSGCANKYVTGICDSNNATSLVDYGNNVSYYKYDLLLMHNPVTPGTSGGCVAYRNSNNETMLTGIVCASNSEYSMHTKYGLVKSRFNLTTLF